MGDVFPLQALTRHVTLFAQTAGGKEYETVTVNIWEWLKTYAADITGFDAEDFSTIHFITQILKGNENAYTNYAFTK